MLQVPLPALFDDTLELASESYIRYYKIVLHIMSFASSWSSERARYRTTVSPLKPCTQGDHKGMPLRCYGVAGLILYCKGAPLRLLCLVITA